jgi:hypothetical protein
MSSFSEFRTSDMQNRREIYGGTRRCRRQSYAGASTRLPYAPLEKLEESWKQEQEHVRIRHGGRLGSFGLQRQGFSDHELTCVERVGIYKEDDRDCEGSLEPWRRTAIFDILASIYYIASSPFLKAIVRSHVSQVPLLSVVGCGYSCGAGISRPGSLAHPQRRLQLVQETDPVLGAPSRPGHFLLLRHELHGDNGLWPDLQPGCSRSGHQHPSRL